MDSNEAKLILSGHTLQSPQESNPKLDAALALARQDPDLASWWETQQAKDRAIQGKLQSFKVPSDLRSALKESIAQKSAPKTLKFPKWARWGSIAATVLLASSLYFKFGIDRSDDFEGPLVQMAYDYSIYGPRLSYFDKNSEKLKDWLEHNGFDLPEQLPDGLLELEGIGCRPLKWSQEGVALMCFNAETAYHLFVAKSENFPKFEASEIIEYDYRQDGWTVSKWKSGDNVFVLTAKSTPQMMAQYLASYQPE